MDLDAEQLDRARGALLGAAAGDALGAGYEFTFPGPDVVPQMKGGGLGDFAPGEWTDDTDQTAAIARVAARGLDLRSDEALDAITAGFLEWFAGGPADIGTQTREVLQRVVGRPTGSAVTEAARQVHVARGRSAGNGSLMRTAPVALAYLDDPEALVEAALAVSGLTHHEAIAGQSCVVWCLFVRHAVLAGELPSIADVARWVPDVAAWADLVETAASQEPSTFAENAWSVGALQAAWSAITHTSVPSEDPPRHLVDALGTAVRIGHDTDTVASIAGALLGARWGASAVPAEWRAVLHGWPGLTGEELADLGEQIVSASGSAPPG